MFCVDLHDNNYAFYYSIFSVLVMFHNHISTDTV